VPAALSMMRFENYKITKENTIAYEKSREFMESKKSLYLYGQPGGGKTHLMASSLYQARCSHCSHQFAFYNIAKLLKIERESFETREEAEEKLLSRLARKEIIFLDDFCSENVTGRTAEFLYLLLNDAIENGKPRFFITGNKSLKFISENVSDRIASRLSGLCGRENIIKLESEDWRLK
jgi:DNA replication protein DnaC